jgi:D-alanine-D-alanine ligase
MRIAILYTLPTKRARDSAFIETDEDTIESAQEVAKAITDKGSTPILVGLPEDAIEKTIRSITADCIVNLIDWTGLDLPLSLQAMDILESTGIPFTGASRRAFELGADKIAMKKQLDVSRLPTPRWQLFNTGKEAVRKDFSYPVIVKLAKEHCSIGLGKASIVKNNKELIVLVGKQLITYQEPVIAEEFISGREFQITLLEKKSGLTMLPPAEVTYKVTGTRAMLSYESRWEEKHPDFHTSGMALAKLTDEQLQTFETICKKAFRAFGFTDFTRIDARLNDKGEFMFLEANANPGLSDHPLYGMTVSYKAVDMTFNDFVWEIIQSCLRRWKA